MVENENSAEEGIHSIQETDSEGAREDTNLREVVAELESDLSRSREEAAGLRESLDTAVAKYKGALLSTLPEIPEELVGGETVDEVDASLERAMRIVSKVRQELEGRVSPADVPTGAPARAMPDMSTLSPAEKIAHGLARQ